MPPVRGPFTFVAPAGTDGRTIVVELVDWGAETTVGVSGTVAPTAIPAGISPWDVPDLLAMLALALGLLGTVRLVHARS